MSYILDALRNAERQRPRGQGPELFQVPGPRGPGGGLRGWLVAAAAAVVGVAIGVGVWLALAPPRDGARLAAEEAATPLAERIVEATHPRPRASEELPVVSPAVTEPAAHRPPAVPGRKRTAARRRAPESPAAAPPSRLPPRVPAPRTAPEPVAAATEQTPPAPPAPIEAVTRAPLPASGQPAAAAAGSGGAEPPARAVTAVAATVEEPAPAPAAAELPVAPARPEEVTEAAHAPPPPVPPPDGRVLTPATLPAEILPGWPNVALSGHVWSEEQELRLVVVDGRIVREGDEAAPGVGLERITPEGAILRFRGYRLLVEAP